MTQPGSHTNDSTAPNSRPARGTSVGRGADGIDGGRTLSRRAVLATGAAAAGAFAGCTGGVTSHEFEAAPVRLPAAAREELVLAETAFDSSTVTREPDVGGVEGEVTITSHAATVRRGPARGDFAGGSDAVVDLNEPSLIETFIGRVNGTEGAGPAEVVAGSDVGVDEVTLDFLEEDPTVPGSGWSLVVPAGVRADGDGDGGAVRTNDMLYLVPASAVPGDEWVPGNEWIPGSRWFPGSKWFPGSRWFPGSEWVPGDEWFPGSSWFPGSQWEPDDPEALRVLVVTESDSWAEQFGVSAEEVGGRPLREGEAIPAEHTVFAVPGSNWAPSDNPDWDPAALFDAGVPAPTRGATFGATVLSTPRAEVAGEVLNPYASEELETLIQGDRARDLLRRVGLTEAEDVRWLAGPEAVSVGGQSPFTVLDRETELRSFTGVVNGDDGPWGVGLHVARVENGDDAVIAAAGHRTPVGTADLEGADYAFDFDNPHEVAWFEQGGELTGATFERLEEE